MSVLLLESVDEVLEIVTVPFAAETFHNLDIPAAIFFLVFRQLVVASAKLTQIVGTNQVTVHVKNMDLVAGDHILDCGVGILLGYGILAGLIRQVWQASNLVIREISSMDFPSDFSFWTVVADGDVK